MRRAPAGSLLALALVVALALTGCTKGTVLTVKDADGVRVSIEEAERGFLYSRVEGQGIVEFARTTGRGSTGPRLYAFTHDAAPRELVGRDPAEWRLGRDTALVAISLEPNVASVNLWNWIEGRVDRVSIRLDSPCARELPGGAEGERLTEVVFAAQEPALFPGARDRDYELFAARLARLPRAGSVKLDGLRQLTHNSTDDSEPSFSPDGRWIVFVSEQMGPRNVGLMDSQGDFLRLLTTSSSDASYHPVVLPDNEQCLYVCHAEGEARFRVCGLDGQGDRMASAAELRQMVYSWDDRTRHAYLLMQAFAHDSDLRLLLELPGRLDLQELLTLAEWNAPVLKECRARISAARAARESSRLERGATVGTSAGHMASVGVFLDEPDESPQDRPVEGFTRYLAGLSVPLFTGRLDKAVAQRDLWQEMVYSQRYAKERSALALRVVSDYYEYCEHTMRQTLLERVLQLNRKRRFIWEARVQSGLDAAEKLTEADAYIAETEADIAAAAGLAAGARGRILATLGLTGTEPVQILTAPLVWASPPFEVPPLAEFQALAQVNHPDLLRLKFLELRAAAIRDMGPPAARGRPELGFVYGFGVEDVFSRAVDDFISVGLGHTIPVALLGLGRTYREQWTQEMLAYRAERTRVRADLDAELRGSREAIRRVVRYFASARKWRGLAAERARVSRIRHARIPIIGEDLQEAVEPLQLQIDLLQAELELVGLRAEFARLLAAYYHRAGLGDRLGAVLGGARMDAPRQARALWLWRSLDVVLDPALRQRFLQDCVAHGVTRVYCFVSRVENALYLRRYNWEFGYFLDLCRERGVEVHALVGNPQWLERSYRAEIGAVVRSVLEFNARAREGFAAFRSLKLDVEPHALPEWRHAAGRSGLGAAYLDLLDFVRAQLRSEPGGLPLRADVPPNWVGVEAAGVDLFDGVCARLDALTVMAYRDSPEDMVSSATPVLERAASFGLPVEVGVEVGRVAERGVSFAGQTLEELTVALGRAYQALAVYPGFAGFAIHDYSAFRQMIEQSDAHQIPPH
jgi:outer membrane protein TolC